MLLFIILTIAALTGIVYGIVKKNKTLLITSAVLLIIIVIILLVYSYQYSKNPY